MLKKSKRIKKRFLIVNDFDKNIATLFKHSLNNFQYSNSIFNYFVKKNKHYLTISKYFLSRFIHFLNTKGLLVLNCSGSFKT